jgi:hypothetical protein
MSVSKHTNPSPGNAFRPVLQQAGIKVFTLSGFPKVFLPDEQERLLALAGRAGCQDENERK